MSHDTEATSSKRKYDSAIDTSCAFETNDLNLTTVLDVHASLLSS
jgi:hypothetical protein